MIKSISIKNFIILRDIEIQFNQGFTVITGETGAGKSIIIKAIHFLCGSGQPLKMIRDDDLEVSVGAEFVTSQGIIISCQRNISKHGRTRCIVDGEHVPQNTLFRLTSSLIDITSQAAFSHLLNADMHLRFYDMYCNMMGRRRRLEELAAEHSKLKQESNLVKVAIDDFKHRQELYEYQLEQIDEVNPEAGENIELKEVITRLENYEDLFTSGTSIVDTLTDGENSVDSSLAIASKYLQTISAMDSKLAGLPEELESSRSVIREIASRVRDRCLRGDFEPDKLEELRQRQHAISALIRKYGGSYAALLEHRDMLRESMGVSEKHSAKLQKLIVKQRQIIDDWIALSAVVKKARLSKAEQFEKRINQSLNQLGVRNAEFKLDIKKSRDIEKFSKSEDSTTQLDGRGSESVDFLFSANLGIAPKALAKVASGGELSRLLLAIKEALPIDDHEASVFLDEIDSGVSGNIAHLVGKKLKVLSKNRQMIAITHLPQIAGQADFHLKVSKTESNDTTYVDVHELDSANREEEIAKMISGGELTSAAMQQASHLIDS